MKCVELIASENFTSRAVMECGSLTGDLGGILWDLGGILGGSQGDLGRSWGILAVWGRRGATARTLVGPDSWGLSDSPIVWSHIQNISTVSCP